jgi:hypothetical protein
VDFPFVSNSHSLRSSGEKPVMLIAHIVVPRLFECAEGLPVVGFPSALLPGFDAEGLPVVGFTSALLPGFERRGVTSCWIYLRLVTRV